MQHKPISPNFLPNDALPFGLGCSRLGSVNGASMDLSRQILQQALDAGVRFFDTSSIYAQGDSERLLGEMLKGRTDCIVCSKAGKYLSWKKRLLVPFKGVITSLARNSDQARRSVSTARSKPMPTRWDSRFLADNIEASLRRLKREQIEMFMLHSPSATDLTSGDAIGALETAQQAGKLGRIGVSVDDVACAQAALNDPRVQVLQIPVLPGATEFEAVITQAAKAGVQVIAREIFGGAAAIAGATDPAVFAASQLQNLIQRTDIALPLIGTTKSTNLQASIAAAKAVA